MLPIVIVKIPRVMLLVTSGRPRATERLFLCPQITTSYTDNKLLGAALAQILWTSLRVQSSNEPQGWLSLTLLLGRDSTPVLLLPDITNTKKKDPAAENRDLVRTTHFFCRACHYVADCIASPLASRHVCRILV